MKKAVKIIVISILILILFRGIAFRLAIKYYEIGNRPEIKITNEKLIKKIESEIQNRKINLKSICKITDKITKEELEFTTKRASNNPNELINTKKANCVGYSTMFNSIANYLIKKRKLEGEIAAQHKIGQLEIFGINVHQYFKSSFFRDHDFNELTDKKTGKTISIDPTVSDYLWINRISRKK